MVLQSVATLNYTFTDIYVGCPGSVHDARVLRNSPLFDDANEDLDGNFPGNTHLLADSAYQLLSWIIPPFKDYGNLSRRQRNFNFHHSGARLCIEHSYGLLKGRFRQLRCVDMQIESVSNFITACCCLHNICLKSGGNLDEYFKDYNEDVSTMNPNVFNSVFDDEMTETQKRENIANIFAE